MAGVFAALEPWDEGKLAGWKRGRDGSLRDAAVPDELWREWRVGRGRRS
jgi:hypothetical protein